LPALARLANGKFDRTEVDMRLGDLLVEAKLTEGDFQKAPKATVRAYRDFSDVFVGEGLPQTERDILSYQLIRNVLAPHASDCSFCVLTDARRPRADRILVCGGEVCASSRSPDAFNPKVGIAWAFTSSIEHIRPSLTMTASLTVVTTTLYFGVTLTAVRDLPHSRQFAFDRDVINPQYGHILCDPYPVTRGFSLRIL
jgi:hypothetical protein